MTHRDSDILGRYTAPAAPVQGEEVQAGEHTPTPWAYRPNEYDDWGWIRGSDGALAAIARNSKSCDDFDEHRRAGTDPYGANAALIVKAVNSYVARREESMAAYQRIDELETELTQWVRQAEDNSGEAQRCALRVNELETALKLIARSAWTMNPADLSAIASAALEPFPAESGDIA